VHERSLVLAGEWRKCAFYGWLLVIILVLIVIAIAGAVEIFRRFT